MTKVKIHDQGKLHETVTKTEFFLGEYCLHRGSTFQVPHIYCDKDWQHDLKAFETSIKFQMLSWYRAYSKYTEFSYVGIYVQCFYGIGGSEY